jgi:hypothetical protein
MASLDDLFNQLKDINTNLQQVDADTLNVKASVDTARTSIDQELTQVNDTLNAGFTNVSQGFQALITLQTFTNQALVHNSQQNDTIICILDYIAKTACELLNEAQQQTKLQRSLKGTAMTLLEIFKIANPAAALEFERLEVLRKRLLECCPEPVEPGINCDGVPDCEPSSQLGNPPTTDYPPFQSRPSQPPIP